MESGAEDIISVGVFIRHLTYFIKISIFANMGTEDELTLNRCIKIYNKYKTIEAAKEMTNADNTYTRKGIKRTNLVLKVDDNCAPLNILDKQNQIRMMHLNEHPAISEDQYYEFRKYARENNINVFSDVPFIFMVRGKYSELLWQYLRAIFYISQYLLARTRPGADPSDPNVQRKIKVSDDSLDKLSVIIEKISTIESKTKIHNLMAKDKFLNTVCVKTGINEADINMARLQVKDLFKGRGLDQDSSMGRMIDRISDELTGKDFENGNIIETMIGVAQTVAEELSGEFETNPDKFQKTLFSVVEVFKEQIESVDDGDTIPEDLKETFNKLANLAPAISEHGTTEMPDSSVIIEALDSIINKNGLDRDKFYDNIRDTEGGISADKLQEVIRSISKGKDIDGLLKSISTQLDISNHPESDSDPAPTI